MTNASESVTALSTVLTEYLQSPRPVIVTTIDSESHWPSNNLITWVLATSPTAIRLAADAKGRIIGNVRADERVLLTLFAGGSCHVIEGTGRVVADLLPSVSLKLSCVEVSITAVRDATFFGGKITADPQYDVTYDINLKNKLDASVLGDMKSL